MNYCEYENIRSLPIYLPKNNTHHIQKYQYTQNKLQSAFFLETSLHPFDPNMSNSPPNEFMKNIELRMNKYFTAEISEK